MHRGFWWGNVREGDHLEDPGMDGRIILMGSGRHVLDRCGSGQEQVTGTCECGNEPSGSVKCGDFLD